MDCPSAVTHFIFKERNSFWVLVRQHTYKCGVYPRSLLGLVVSTHLSFADLGENITRPDLGTVGGTTSKIIFLLF